MRLVRPRPLEKGGTIAVVAPAGPIDAVRLDAGVARLEEAGFTVRRREDAVAQDGYLAGDDGRRAEELMDAVRDPAVAAIWCARGGYGCQRILSRLDAEAVCAARKPLIGYSDITTLLLWQQRAGLVGFHGPMFEREEGPDADDLAYALAILGGATGEPLCGQPGRAGVAEGPLVGGSLSLVVASLGTPWEIDTRAAILLLEEKAEAPYRLDRMLLQLREAGKLAEVAGIGIGSLLDCDDDRPGAIGCDAVVEEVIGELGVPWVRGLPFGHDLPNRTWGHGVRARLEARPVGKPGAPPAGTLAMLEPSVE